MPRFSRLPQAVQDRLPQRIPTWKELTSSPRALRTGLNLWPPYRFAGVRVEEISDDWRYARVRLGFSPLTRNYVGTQFGGSMTSMVDPFWMLLVMENLGRDYVVWDKAAEIEFVRPGRTRLRADFDVTDELLDELRARAADGSKVLHWCETEIKDTDGEVVARVRKQLYVRLKRKD